MFKRQKQFPVDLWAEKGQRDGLPCRRIRQGIVQKDNNKLSDTLGSTETAAVPLPGKDQGILSAFG